MVKKTLAQKIQERNELLKHAYARIDGYTIQQLRKFLASKGPKKHESTGVSNEAVSPPTNSGEGHNPDRGRRIVEDLSHGTESQSIGGR